MSYIFRRQIRHSCVLRSFVARSCGKCVGGPAYVGHVALFCLVLFFRRSFVFGLFFFRSLVALFFVLCCFVGALLFCVRSFVLCCFAGALLFCALFPL